MRRAGHGRIVNLSSIGGRLTFPGGGAYHGAKHAVEAFSDALRFEVAGFGIQVVVIEPGLIRTEFANAAVGSMADVSHEGPYGEFNTAVGRETASAYEGGLARLGGGPETVARKIERAITARRPRPRYSVTPSAKISLGARALMTDRMWDRFVGTQFPRPR
jgi:NAD(P)-dependent dehydrogenase (short-subunit alcohol dehydrogenase family)